jgi:hypothetical protein
VTLPPPAGRSATGFPPRRVAHWQRAARCRHRAGAPRWCVPRPRRHAHGSGVDAYVRGCRVREADAAGVGQDGQGIVQACRSVSRWISVARPSRPRRAARAACCAAPPPDRRAAAVGSVSRTRSAVSPHRPPAPARRRARAQQPEPVVRPGQRRAPRARAPSARRARASSPSTTPLLMLLSSTMTTAVGAWPRRRRARTAAPRPARSAARPPRAAA